MSRERCLALLTSVSDLLGSQIPQKDTDEAAYNELLTGYQECLTDLGAIVNLTSDKNDETERIILCSSYSIWAKSLDAISCQLDFCANLIESGSSESTKQKIIDAFNDEIAIYRVRLTRGIIILCRNLTYGIQKILNGDEEEVKEYYIARNIRINEIYELNQLIRILYTSHDKCFSKLSLMYIEILSTVEQCLNISNEGSNNPSILEKYHAIEDFYIKSIIASYECLANITNLKLIHHNECESKTTKFENLNNLDQVTSPIIRAPAQVPLQVKEDEDAFKIDKVSVIKFKGIDLLDIKKIDIIQNNRDLLIPFLLYCYNISENSKRMKIPQYDSLISLIDSMHFFFRVTSNIIIDRLDKKSNDSDESEAEVHEDKENDFEVQSLLLKIIISTLTDESFISAFMQIIDYCNSDKVSAVDQNKGYQCIAGILKSTQIIVAQNFQNILEDNEKLMFITLASIEFLQKWSPPLQSLITKQNSEIDSQRLKNLKRYYKLMLMTLDCISNLIQYNYAREMINSYKILETVLDLLQIVEANTVRAKLKDEKITPLENSGIHLKVGLLDANSSKKELPYLKSIIIEIITGLVYDNFKNQELVRNKHCIEIILSNCNVDKNEPFIKERSILCLKYLLLKNQANQDFISKMEAQRINLDDENEETLRQAGYEIDIVDGKVKLKKGAKIEEFEKQLHK